MISRIELSGEWEFCLDKEKQGLEQSFFNVRLQDRINLPATVSEAKKGIPTQEENTYFLTDPYLFEGYTWYSKEVDFAAFGEKEFILVLERTRISHVWVDDNYAGTCDSLCTSHRYRLTPLINRAKHRLTIMVDNTSYTVKGGHMTSQDTQTNWNGITGGIYIEVFNAVYLTELQLYPDAEKRLLKVRAVLNGPAGCPAEAAVFEDKGKQSHAVRLKLIPGINEFICRLDETAQLWSEYSPCLYHLQIVLQAANMEKDLYDIPFGLRSFKASGKYFEINGSRTFLRGKHDGMIFPLTGYAPTDIKSWMDIFKTAKSYGINHYRFHTCCPPEAAFTAADMSGIYLEPELPFWGTVTEEGEANHDERAQQYLINEGIRILDEFGNHPSFVMMSMGNELWGSRKRLNEILGNYKQYDSRHLYTQGSNNFQFVPCILENEDFFCGVRFSRDRLFRGSYAMCDAPQGHIQTAAPNSNHSYDNYIRPAAVAEGNDAGGSIVIQYGTGTKTVQADAGGELIPGIPVISHEIGQYAMYPDLSEIDKYTGVLKPRNLMVFRRRLEQAGMLAQAEMFFRASGRFAAQCYKAEIETALRSGELAGFQLLDLQDFTGQGTALVGILNAFMENKGVISKEEWRQFCSETVLLAELPSFVFRSGETISIGIRLAQYGRLPINNPEISLKISGNGDNSIILAKESIPGKFNEGIYRLCSFSVTMPETDKPQELALEIYIEGTEVRNHYDLWIYPEAPEEDKGDIIVTGNLSEAYQELKKGKDVLLFPDNLDEHNSIQGTYCTDFWCYPMFRSISESMNKPVPVGTLGLLIDKDNPVFSDFPTQYYTTAQWYDIAAASRSVILNGTDIEPLVWTIDNFERNNRLGLLFEVQTGEARLMVCASDLRKLTGNLPADWLYYSILKFMKSDRFSSELNMDTEDIGKIFKK